MDGWAVGQLEDLPCAGHALELMFAHGCEPRRLTRDGDGHRRGDERLLRARERHDTSRDVDRGPGDVVAAAVDVADVDVDPQLQAVGREAVHTRSGGQGLAR